jgi:hypothetical protein
MAAHFRLGNKKPCRIEKSRLFYNTLEANRRTINSMADDKKISKHQFYFETPLYEVIDTTKADSYLFSGEVDAYSAQNGIETTYKVSSKRLDSSYGFLVTEGGFGEVTLKCKRKNNDELRFFLLVDVGENLCVKVGQWPSLADLQFAEIGKKYDKLLDRQDLQEFKKAVGLAAHGTGVGSFVYLRRIFENLIEETYQAHKDTLELTEDEFRKKRMAEKVGVLSAYLPPQLIQMKGVYAILSKGVHELDEQECLAYFPVLKTAIELILEQKIEAALKLQRDKDVQSKLAEIEAKLKKERTPGLDKTSEPKSSH